MHDGGMPHRDQFADQTGVIIGQMDDGVILNVGAGTDFDAVDIAPEDRPKPNAGLIAQCDVTQDRGLARNIHIPTEPGLASQITIKALATGAHPLTMGS